MVGALACLVCWVRINWRGLSGKLIEIRIASDLILQRGELVWFLYEIYIDLRFYHSELVIG